MHTPPQSSSKGPRRSSKQQKQKDATHRSVQSDNDAYQISSQDGDRTPSKGTRNRQGKKSHAQKPSGALSEAGEHSDGIAHRHPHYAEKSRATPMKPQAYAGPTFHQSPAASALPMPSFYSRSVPNPGFINPIAEAPNDCIIADHNRSTISSQGNEEERKSTPLDFLFDAARKAQTTPNGGSPGPRQHLLSPPYPSPAARSTGLRDPDTDFPFELESPDRTPREGGSGHSTPFKNRLEAARSPLSTPDSNQGMTEEERRAKSAALKKALMNPHGVDQLINTFRDTNPFNARNAPTSPNMPMHHQSNHSTPGALPSQNPADLHASYFSQRPNSPNRNNYTQTNQRPPSSNLRNIYEPGSQQFSTGQHEQQTQIPAVDNMNSAPQPNYASVYGGEKSNQAQQDVKQPNAQQGLHDLRKVLNLDLMGRG